MMKIRLLLTCVLSTALVSCSFGIKKQQKKDFPEQPEQKVQTSNTLPEKKTSTRPPATKTVPSGAVTPPKSATFNDTPMAPRMPGVTVNRVGVSDKVVALTFDDGPHGALTPRVLDILRDNGVHATFFMQGCNVVTHPQIVQRMVQEGHEVGNHTWNHTYLSKVSREKAEDQLSRTQEAIRNACGVTPVVMRPPGGYTNAGVASWARNRFGVTTIMWDVDTNDWRKPGSSVVAARAVNGAKPGSIILVHDIHASTVAAVDSLVKGLKNRGYRLVTVSELIRLGREAAGSTPGTPSSTPQQEVLPSTTEIPVSPITPADQEEVGTVSL